MSADLSKYDEETWSPPEKVYKDRSAACLPDSVKDQDYHGVIVRSVAKEAPQNKDGQQVADFLAELTIRVVGGAHDGTEFDETWWVNNKDDFKRLIANLGTFGFDVANWIPKNGRKQSVEMVKAIERLTGLHFAFGKKTNSSKGKTFHNIYFNRRLNDADGKPAILGPDYLDAPLPKSKGDQPF